jgi:hypothetical protein
MKKNKQVFSLLGVVFGLGFMYYMAAVQVPKILVSTSKASTTLKVSISDSYLLGEKLIAKADGEDACVINAFLLDSSGKGVSGKMVELRGTSNIKAIEPATDNEGKMSFEVRSKTEGQVKLEAEYEGVPLPNSVTVTFRN